MENTTTVLPNATGPGFYAATGGRGADYGCLDELIQSNNIHNNATSILNAIHTSTASIIAANQAASLADIEATNRNGSTTLGSIERNGGEGRLVTERTAGETRLNIYQTSAETRELVRDVSFNILNAVRDTKDEVFREGNKTREELLKGFAQVNLEACKNADAIRAAIAECCCEQKELTRAEANATRELILSQNTANLNSQLVDAKNANLLLNIKAKV